jgi:hypothetical protein
LVTIFSLHVILAYLRRTGERISQPNRQIAASFASQTPRPLDTSGLADARVAKIISDIPQRRIRGRALASVR